MIQYNILITSQKLSWNPLCLRNLASLCLFFRGTYIFIYEFQTFESMSFFIIAFNEKKLWSFSFS